MDLMTLGTWLLFPGPPVIILIYEAQRLEGMPQNSDVHAGGGGVGVGREPPLRWKEGAQVGESAPPRALISRGVPRVVSCLRLSGPSSEQAL